MKSTLEVFSEKVVHGTLNIQPKKKGESDELNLGLDITAITALIEVVAQVILEIMTNCSDKQRLPTSVKKPNFMQRIRFRAAVKDAVESSGNLRAKVYAGRLADNVMKEAATLTEEEILKIVDEAETLDNWII